MNNFFLLVNCEIIKLNPEINHNNPITTNGMKNKNIYYPTSFSILLFVSENGVDKFINPIPTLSKIEEIRIPNIS